MPNINRRQFVRNAGVGVSALTLAQLGLGKQVFPSRVADAAPLEGVRQLPSASVSVFSFSDPNIRAYGIEWARQSLPFSNGHEIVFDERADPAQPLEEDNWLKLWFCRPSFTNPAEYRYSSSALYLPQFHHGRAVVHPGGNWLVTQALRADLVPGEPVTADDFLYNPGVGFYNELWAINMGSSSTAPVAHRLTTITPEPAPITDYGALHAKFNDADTKLVWMRHKQGPGAGWSSLAKLCVADWLEDTRSGSPTPGLYNIVEYNASTWNTVCEPGDWIGDQYVTYATNGNYDDFGVPGRMQLFKLDVTQPTPTPIALTLDNPEDPQYWDEFAEVSPDNMQIAWTTDRTDPEAGTSVDRFIAEVWLMDTDGSNKSRITDLNGPGSPFGDGARYAARDLVWSPGGTQLMAKVFRTGALNIQRVHLPIHIDLEPPS
ncbi:MAG: TolB family protein [Ardenticatenaceae bacterium]